MTNRSNEHGTSFVLVVGLVVFLCGLAVFAYLGYYNRYWADDWCYNLDFKKLGFWGTMYGYTNITTYAANRFSLTFFSGLFYFGGLPGVQLMTLLVIIFLTGGLYKLLENINVLASFSFSKLQTLFMTAVIVFYSIYTAPHLYQSLYWRSGLLPYTAPIVFGIWVFVLITTCAVYKSHLHVFMIISGLLSFIVGGFSEAGNATFTAMLLVYIFACLFVRHRMWAQESLPIAVVSLIASIAAMIALIVSPTITYRIDLYDGFASLAEFPRLLAYYTFEFIALNILGAPSTYLVIFGTLLTFGMLPSYKSIR